MELSKTIDHTVLKADCTVDDIKKLCKEAIEFDFAAVCVPPYFVKDAARLLNNSTVNVATVVGFPMGYSTTSAKVEEIKRAINDGANEIDAVINISAVKEQQWNYIKSDLDSVIMATHLRGKVIKIIIETALLSKEEILKLCNICSDMSVDYVKTSTGFNGGGATKEIVAFLREHLPDSVKIKASGGIRDAKQALDMIEAGASRIGTSSGIAIISDATGSGLNH